ncbi:hypothetical protein K3495_g17322 [Podosphaera aphanis]|nr:hypothetical protein K3495_g17322 [Podosphaera aphanis]
MPALVPNPASYQCSSTPPETVKDADGDTRMTGVNKTRDKWVSPKELDRRRSIGACVRCGNRGHKSPNCQQLPPQRPQTAVKPANLVEESYEDVINNYVESEELKD